MSEGIRRIFYDLTTGDKIHEIGRNGSFTLPTIDQDIATYTALSERNRDTFDVLELPFGAYVQDFVECNGYRVNVELLATLSDDRKGEALEFSYPDQNEPTAPQVFQKPLTIQLDELKLQLESAQEAIDFLIMNGGI